MAPCGGTRHAQGVEAKPGEGACGKAGKREEEAGSLRASLFSHVPPFISSIPIPAGRHGWATPSRLAPPVDQHDQLWRMTAAVAQVVNDLLMDKNIGKKLSYDSSYPFRKQHCHAQHFEDVHCLAKCRPFPNLMILSKKDSLWKAVRSKAEGAMEEQGKSMEAHAWSFLAPTLLLPQDRTAFLKLLSEEPMTSLWIAKPSSANRGNGIRLVNKNSDLEELVLTTESVCMQRYLADPYLLPSRLKFDLRVYVLITSWDPIRIYVYRDGLVKFCTREYSSCPSTMTDLCRHITNPEINKTSGCYKGARGNPDSTEGHKWRLARLWDYLAGRPGVGREGVERVWSNIQDIVIRTLVCADERLRNKISKRKSMYNCYNLTGFDIMLDAALTPHLLEVNTKPQLLPLPLDKAVNVPMVQEIFQLVGFHLPPDVVSSRREVEAVSRMFQVREQDVSGFRHSLYKAAADPPQLEKEERLVGAPRCSPDFLHPLTPLDVRRLVKSEDELNAMQGFQRIFPTSETHKYFRYLEQPVPYSERLMDAFEAAFGDKREEGRQLVESYCQKRVHLS